MKFLQRYQEDILLAFKDHHLVKADFQFVKRKGRIITEHLLSDHTFSFFIRKSAVINEDTGQFEKAHHFEVKQDAGPVTQCPEWSDVMKLFRIWLKGLL